jgi:hypothetical protein
MKRDKQPATLRPETQSERRSTGRAVRGLARASASDRTISAMETSTYFRDRKARANFKEFDRIMKRKSGKAPRRGDEVAPKPVAQIADEESRRLTQVRAAVRGLRKLQREIAERNPEPITDKEIRDAIDEGRP